jgi:transposase
MIAPIAPPANTQIWIAAGVTDMRRGFTGLSALVQTALEQAPLSGHVFAFRGRRGDLIKLLWFDGDGLCLFSKRLERGRFVWPQADSGKVSLTRAQLSMLLERDRLAQTGQNLATGDDGIKVLYMIPQCS